METVLVMDAETSSAPEASGVGLMLAKFERAGFKGRLCWLKGGYGALAATGYAGGPPRSSLVNDVPLSESPVPFGAPASTTPLSFPTNQPGRYATAPPFTAPIDRAPNSSTRVPRLSVRDLPVEAFQLSSTSQFAHRGFKLQTPALRTLVHTSNAAVPQTPAEELATPNTLNKAARHPLDSHSSDGSGGGGVVRRPSMAKRRRSNHYDPGQAEWSTTVSAGGETASGSQTISETQIHRDTVGAAKRTTANPFFDNIRQNAEALSLKTMLANLSPVNLPTFPPHLLALLPSFLAELLALTPLERANRLAHQFYDLEAAERDRLTATLDWHANFQGVTEQQLQAGEVDSAERAFDRERAKAAEHFAKFGISAGVELGNLNRYKNIFPYDHTRVRLEHHNSDATDYINASHIALAGTTKRFIASQGPLASTVCDFWQMCWQENVGCIVMLTNLYEGGREKCGRYWTAQELGPWIIDIEGMDEDDGSVPAGLAPGAEAGGFFGASDSKGKEHTTVRNGGTTIARLICLRERSNPSVVKRIRHLQYVAWPDFDIPADPRDVIRLVDQVEEAQRVSTAELVAREGRQPDKEPPVVVHCSGGVGRSGVFILVSALLGYLRSQRADDLLKKTPTQHTVEMDVDRSPAKESPERRHRLLTPPSQSSGDSMAGYLTPDATKLSTRMEMSFLHDSLTDTQAEQALAAEAEDEVAPLASDEPIKEATNEMREQRMSMVANYRQYVCVYECALIGLLKEMEAEGLVAP